MRDDAFRVTYKLIVETGPGPDGLEQINRLGFTLGYNINTKKEAARLGRFVDLRLAAVYAAFLPGDVEQARWGARVLLADFHGLAPHFPHLVPQDGMAVALSSLVSQAALIGDWRMLSWISEDTRLIYEFKRKKPSEMNAAKKRFILSVAAVMESVCQGHETTTEKIRLLLEKLDLEAKAPNMSRIYRNPGMGGLRRK